ncbi:hypothetical protein JWS13_38985 [Rhodococcus pseudokoreensis]|uniref:Polymerase nucleotidyl transferase domain-containing protein n=1 Tax=Rhodococcus pseudokoreensis TaxID=2811421 RepID=A0A974ZXM0_9NOCA|nr:hypothetical protein [Rhodococcus pseudokoreensis]QSE94164.1 hypothetical protein JWS13_38985 [Rhodococcus pseudokoreensis]
MLDVDAGMFLPPGRVRTTLSEVRDVWGFNAHRQNLLDEFEKFLALISKVVGIEAYWLSGTLLSDKEVPSDVDVVFVINEDKINSLAAGAKRLVTAKGLAELADRRNLRVDGYVLPWRVRPSVTIESEDEEYLRLRGYWDDFWMRRRSVPKGDPPERLCALPRRGYVEVIVDGYK